MGRGRDGKQGATQMFSLKPFILPSATERDPSMPHSPLVCQRGQSPESAHTTSVHLTPWEGKGGKHAVPLLQVELSRHVTRGSEVK